MNILLGLVKCLRKAVAANTNAPIDLVVKLDLPVKIISLFKIPSNEILYEAAWIINNIAAEKEEYCNLLLKLNCPKSLLPLLDSKDDRIPEMVKIFFPYKK